MTIMSLKQMGASRRGHRLVAILCALVMAAGFAVASAPPATALTGPAPRLHDPSVIKVGSCYYAFSTGFENDPQNPNGQVTEYRSCGSAVGPWTKVMNVFSSTPAWAVQMVGPTIEPNIWSPDINFFDGQYHLYYSAVRSSPNWYAALGVATATNIEGPWTDQGFVTDVNFPIDADVFTAQDGTMYINWGSFGGIFQHVLDPATGKLSQTDHNLWHLSSDVEGSSVTYNGGYYYYFASDGPCCAGINSNYWTVVGRSTSPHGPFLDQAGNSLVNAGAGTNVLIGNWPKTNAGGGDVYVDGSSRYFAYHYYDANNNGRETMDIRQLTFANGWPVFGTPIGETQFHLTNLHSRLCADVWFASTANQAAVNQGTCNDGANQRWTLSPNGSNYLLVNANSGKCLELFAFNTTAGAPVTQYTCNGSATQLWTKTTTVGGFSTFRNVNSGQCLEVYGWSTASGAAMVQWPCTGGANQTWSLG